jgi:hypothetical protein
VQYRSIWFASLLAGMMLISALPIAANGQFGDDAFESTWERTDRPVSTGEISRTWMWGPAPFTPGILEDYEESVERQRLVQYFDKARMEITRTYLDPDDLWYVTNGRLVVEILFGLIQVGDDEFINFSEEVPEINIAGDPDDPNAPTYRTFNSVMGLPPGQIGDPIIKTVDRAGNVSVDESFATYEVTTAYIEPNMYHSIPSVFWDFMHEIAPVYVNGEVIEDRLFENAFYATGYPISEPYWTTVRVGGEPKHVLVQAFERRVMTYTPANPEGWQVESGNVGQHYYLWRYGTLPFWDEPGTSD